MKHTKHWKYLKLSAIIFWSLFLLFVVIINIGCTNPTVIEINNTIYINRTINHTIYIYNTTIEPYNITCPKVNTTIYNRDYVLGLIRQLKYYEKQQVKYWNVTECVSDLNNTNIELDRCKQELCNEWNSSWC